MTFVISIHIVACLFTMCPEKKTKIFFCNISYKIWAILMKFGTLFPE